MNIYKTEKIKMKLKENLDLLKRRISETQTFVIECLLSYMENLILKIQYPVVSRRRYFMAKSFRFTTL